MGRKEKPLRERADLQLARKRKDRFEEASKATTQVDVSAESSEDSADAAGSVHREDG